MTDDSVPAKQVLSFQSSYRYRTIWFAATVAGCSLIFTVFVFLFLHAYLNTHSMFNLIDPIKEMIGYAELFFLTFSCYYIAGFLVYWGRRILARFTSSFIPIAIVGSLIFSFYSSIRLSPTISDETVNTFLFLSMAVSFVTVVTCAIASTFQSESERQVT
jgi:hypothetical protein